MTSRHGWMRGLLAAIVSVLLLGPLAVLTVRALQGAKLVRLHLAPRAAQAANDPRVWLIVALVAAVLALVGWALSELRRTRLERSSNALVTAEHEAREAARRAEQEREEAVRERQREREQHEHFRKAWEAQRHWNRQLRERVAELQQRNGILGRLDVHDMVLRLTVELVEAEKGILLSRHGSNGRDLEVVSSTGFQHDPAESALAKRFADEVIERDTTVREDHGRELDAEADTPADREVNNLLAIPIYLRDDFHGVIVCANREGGFATLEDDVLVAVGDHAGAVLQNSQLHGELRGAYLQTVRILSSVIEVKDPDLRGHSEAVAGYVMTVADRLGFEPRQREELAFAALLHDVGKIGISERILLKPAALTQEEFSVMQLHPRIGYHLVRQIPALESIAPAILHHHERFDGTGYPGRLTGDTIPLEARIIAVADAFNAMITARPYRQPLTVEQACTELERCAGSQFDPEVVSLFVTEVRRSPPQEEATEPILSEPEFAIHRPEGAPVLGGSTFGLVDSVTLLYSHRHFHETVEAEARRAELQGEPFAVVVACLDGLSEVNERDGYGAGDAALQEVADAARRVAARADGRAFRASGKRVALVLPGLDQEQAEKLAEELCGELSSGPRGSVGVAAWQPGEAGAQVAQRALNAARQPEERMAAGAR